MFESEVKPASKTDALHNKLLNEIQSGIKLKKVQCNDRSKPQLSGMLKNIKKIFGDENNFLM